MFAGRSASPNLTTSRKIAIILSSGLAYALRPLSLRCNRERNNLKRVAIIGAAGYVGLELAKLLHNVDFEVIGVTRENGKFLLRDSGFNIVAPQDIRSVGTVDVVVNLAYPSSGPPQHYPTKNREILDQINTIMAPASRLIHVSTQAVFGYGLDRPVIAGPVKMVPDYAYIEAKIELENLLLRQFPSQSLQIVRLGNVWGPGSGAWTVPLSNKILFSEPVGVEGFDGFCNATDVANAASYLSFLISMDELRGHHFYHLAEMSSYRWSAWVERIEKALGQKSVRLPDLPVDPSNLKSEIREALSPVMPGPLYRNLVWGRVTGSRLRGLLRGVGDQRFDKVKQLSSKQLTYGYTPMPAEKTFLHIMGCQKQFETSVLGQWHPPVGFEQSWSMVEAWMSTAGYSISRRDKC